MQSTAYHDCALAELAAGGLAGARVVDAPSVQHLLALKQLGASIAALRAAGVRSLPGEGSSRADTSTTPSAILLQQLLALAASRPGNSAAQQAAVAEALGLFSLAELEALPPPSLQHALLLQPQLLDQLLEAGAASVLQPMLGKQGSGAQVSSSLATLLARAHPAWQHLPQLLAGAPLLLLRASRTLLAWVAAAGCPRLWQLLEATCRPAWQRLVQQAAAPGAAPAQEQEPSLRSGAQVAAGALALAGCHQPWQEQLVRQLVQQPSLAGLQALVGSLPGMCVDAPAAAAAAAPAAPAASEASQDSGTLAWPGEHEWRAAICCDSATHPAQAADPEQVLAAWELAVQHRCWHEAAASLLVAACLAQRADGCVQQQHAAAASAAAAFLAWLQEPMQPERQLQLRQLLLGPLGAPEPAGADQAQRLASLLGRWRAGAGAGLGVCLLQLYLPLAALQQQSCLLGCAPDALLEACVPGLAAGCAAARDRERLRVLCAVSDAIEGASAAAVELVTVSLQAQAQQLAGEPAQLACRHWLAARWLQEPGGAGGCQLACAKRLLVAVTQLGARLKQLGSEAGASEAAAAAAAASGGGGGGGADAVL